MILEEAIRKNDAEAVRTLLKTCKDVNQKESGRYPFLLVARACKPEAQYEIVKMLLDHGADPNTVDGSGCNFLIHHSVAAPPLSIEIVDLLLERGLNINATTSTGETALKRAISTRDLAVVRHLVENGADIRPKKSEDLILHILNGSRYEHQDIDEQIALYLLSKGGNPLLGRDQLIRAVKRGFCDVVQTLLKEGVDVNCRWDNQTPLMFASAEHDDPDSNRYQQLVTILLEAGANVNLVDGTRATALHHAASKGNLPILLTLLNSGAELEIRDLDLNTPLLRAAANKNPETVRLLVERGADVNAINSAGESALLRSCVCGDVESVKLLVERNTDVNIKEPKNKLTPLMAACDGHFVEIAHLLLDHGALVNAIDPDGRTPLVRAITRAPEVKVDIDLVCLLLAMGAEPDARNVDSMTPLMWASFVGLIPIMKILIAQGAAVNAQDVCGVSPLMLAKIYGRKDAEELLISSGAEQKEIKRPICAFEQCPICSRIPDFCQREVPEKAGLPAATVRLIDYQCPYCQSQYFFENEYEFMFRNRDELTRIRKGPPAG